MAVNTIIQYIPLIFLMEAEKSQGDVPFLRVCWKWKIDFLVKAKNTSNPYLRYTVMQSLLSSPALYDHKKSAEILKVGVFCIILVIVTSNSASTDVCWMDLSIG